MLKQRHNKAAFIQVPIIVGVAAAVSVAAIFLGKMLTQNLMPPQPNSENNPPIGQPSDQPGQPGQSGGQTPQGQFFCQSLNRQATAQECDAADTQKKPQSNQPEQSGQSGQQNPNQPGQPSNQNQGNQNMMTPQQDQNNFNPAEVQNVAREISQIKSSIKSLLKKATKASNLGDEASQLTEMSQELDKISSDLKSTSDQDDLQSIVSDFRDANYQETMQDLRTKIEMPSQITRLQKDLKKLATNLKTKSIISAMTKIGFDLGPLQQNVDTIKSTIATIQNNYNSGNLDDAMTDMQDLMDTQSPGDISCVLTALRDASRDLPRIKDPEIKQAAQDILIPIIEAAQSGDYRSACQNLNEVRPQIMKVMQTVMQGGKNTNPQMLEKIQKLQQVVEQKFGFQPEQIPGTNQTNPAP